MVRIHLLMQETRVRFPSQEDPLEKEMATHSSILPGKSHGQRSLAGSRPWGPKETDMTEYIITFAPPQTGFIPSALRIGLHFLFSVLSWDEVRGWRLTTPFLLDPCKISWRLPRGSQFLLVEEHLTRGPGKPPGLFRMRLIFTLQDFCCYPLAQVTQGAGSCLSHPSKRLFPRGLRSDSILFGAVRISIIFREEHMSGIFAWL